MVIAVLDSVNSGNTAPKRRQPPAPAAWAKIVMFAPFMKVVLSEEYTYEYICRYVHNTSSNSNSEIIIYVLVCTYLYVSLKTNKAKNEK